MLYDKYMSIQTRPKYETQNDQYSSRIKVRTTTITQN